MSSTEVSVTATVANKQTIRRLFQAMNEHRVGDLRDYIAADVVDHNKIIHGEADEPGAAFDGFAQQLTAFRDIAMAPQELIAEGGQVVVRQDPDLTQPGSPAPAAKHEVTASHEAHDNGHRGPQADQAVAGVTVVSDVSFSVDHGEIFGIIGPNGAGQTRTVECIEGLRRLDAGRIRVLQLDPRTNRTELRERFGVQLQAAELPERLRVGESSWHRA